MHLKPCSSSKSEDRQVFYCSSCKKTKSIRSGSYLASSNLSFAVFIQLLFYLSNRYNPIVAVAAYTGLSERAVCDWKSSLAGAVAAWMMNNPKPIGGPGLTVEIDEAMFGKSKYNRGTYRKGIWVLGGVCRETGECFAVPCPGNRRSADVLLPLIQQFVLPGTIVHTDGWRAYSSLSQNGLYAHGTVNHTLHFVDPLTGVHTNTQEGLWHHLKMSVDSTQKIEDVFFDWMFRRRFHATQGITQFVNAFNGYLTALAI